MLFNKHCLYYLSLFSLDLFFQILPKFGFFTVEKSQFLRGLAPDSTSTNATILFSEETLRHLSGLCSHHFDRHTQRFDLFFEEKKSYRFIILNNFEKIRLQKMFHEVPYTGDVLVFADQVHLKRSGQLQKVVSPKLATFTI